MEYGEPWREMGMPVMSLAPLQACIFAFSSHFTSHVTLSVTVSSSQTPQCTAEAILLIAACHLGCLLLFRFFASFRFLSRIFSCHTRRHTWSDMPHTLLVYLGSSQLYFWLLSAIFAYIHFLAFLHLIAFLFGFLVFYTYNLQDFGSCLVRFTSYLGLARSVTGTHMV